MSVYNERIKALAKTLDSYSLPYGVNVELSVDNPLCGDRIRLHARASEGMIEAVHCEVRGCLLCQASAAVMSAELQQGVLKQEGLARERAALEAVLNGTEEGAESEASDPPWSIFQPLQAHRSRHSCALLVLDGLQQVMDQTC